MTRLAFRTALALAEWLAPDGVGEALAGDLLERHATRRWGGWHALCELLRSLPALLGWRIRRAGPVAMGAAGLAFVGTRLATSAFWGYLLSQVPLRADHSPGVAQHIVFLLLQFGAGALAVAIVIARRHSIPGGRCT